MAEIHRAGGDLVQQRLPEMARRLSIRVTSAAAASAIKRSPAGPPLEPAGPAGSID